MARTSRCPTCDTNVKVPAAAPRGALVRCPSCDETFQPPFLRPLNVTVDETEDPYDPKTADRYAARRTDGRDVEKEYEGEQKRQGREERRRAGPELKVRKGLMDSPDLFWLCSAFVLTLIVFAGWFGLRYQDNNGTSRSMYAAGGLVVAMFMGLIIWLVLGGYSNQSHRG